MVAALEVRRAAMDKVSEFERRHPSIIAFFRAYPAINEPSAAAENKL
ncbi:hypothetical protein [Paraburkholderia sp. SIMBA_054]|jgi:hypothetical protein